MSKLVVFDQISLDGYFTDANGDMSWAHQSPPDAEWDAFVEGNAKGGGMLLFGRVTYEMMASFWPTPMAAEAMPVVAERMNAMPKVVFSRRMKEASWNETTVRSGDLATEVRALKKASDRPMTVLGSGSIVSQLAQAGLVDEFQIVVTPVVLGGGRTLFEGAREHRRLRHTGTRAFANGNVLVRYEPA